MASEFHPTYFSVSLENPHHLCLLLTCDDNPLMYWDGTYFELIRPLCPSSFIFFSGSNNDFWKGQLPPATYQPLQSLIKLLFLSSESSSESHSQDLNVENANIKVSVFPIFLLWSIILSTNFNRFENEWFDILGEPGGTDGAHQAKGSRNEDKELKETKIFASVLTFL